MPSLNLDYKIIKYKHLEDKWFTLYKMNEIMYAIVVYADNEEDILFSAIQLNYKDALHFYNEIKNNVKDYIGEDDERK